MLSLRSEGGSSNMLKKRLAVLMAMLLVLCMIPTGIYAETGESIASNFVDMPNDWSTDAVKHAVSNGLLKGYEKESGTYINPKGTLTRAEMVTMVNRAFGAKDAAALEAVSDVSDGAWYADEIGKAVKMGTLQLSSTMRPNTAVTRQEAFTILARAFKMESSSAVSLNGFSDESVVADWAADSISALVEKGYLEGSNGRINPKANITRAEMAKLMDNLVKQYFSEAGTFEAVVEAGNVMINAPDVILKGVTIHGDLIVGDGVGDGDVTLEDVIVTGQTIVRGGGVNSFVITGNSDVGNVVIAKVDGNVRISVEGNAKVSVVYINDGKDDVVVEGKIGTLKIESDAPVQINKAEITNIEVNRANADITVSKDAKVTNLTVQSESADLNISGTVSNMTVAKDATGVKVEISKEATVTKMEANADVTQTGDGKPKNTAGTGTIRTESGTTVNTSSSSSGGSSSSSSSSTVALESIGISGNMVVGQTVTAVVTPAAATVSYQWMSCDTSGGAYTNIVGATASTYPLTSNEAGKYVKVTATGTGSYTGTQVSAPSAAVVGLFMTPMDYEGPGGLLGKSNTASLFGTTFNAALAAEDITNWDINTGTTNLTISAITRTGDQSVTFDYVVITGGQGTGTGTITVQAKAAAVSSGIDTNVDSLQITATNTVVNLSAIGGVTAPVNGAAPVSGITETAQFTGTVSWAPSHDPFQSYTPYTATIVLSPKSGYTLTGISGNYFTVAGATATNAADSGTITAVFPTTGGIYGAGTLADPWKIMTIEDLASIGKTHVPTGLTWDYDDYYILNNDLDFNADGSYSNPAAAGSDWNGDATDNALSIKAQMTTGVGWLPLADYDNTLFTGDFNGNGKTISNLFINRTGYDYQSLFGASDGATITDLTLASVNINGGGYTAAFVGDATDTYLQLCSATGTVTGDYMYLGGLVGWFGSSSGSHSIQYSYADVNVTGTGNWAECVGGLVGGISNQAEILGCYTAGDVTGYGRVGGLVGEISHNTTVKNAYATGTVGGFSKVGGLVGSADWDSFIRDSYSLSSVNGDAGSGTAIGGILGYAEDMAGDVSIYNSIAYGAGITGSTNLARILGQQNHSFGSINLGSNYALDIMQINGLTATTNVATNDINGEHINAMNNSAAHPIDYWDWTADNVDGDGVYWSMGVDRPILKVYDGSGFISLGTDTGSIH